MQQPIPIDIPHSLGRAEARRRLRARIGELPAHIPGGIAEVKTDWLDEDRMAISVAALGQTVSGTVEVQDRMMRLRLSLPPLLSFMSGTITKAIEREGRVVLLGDDRDRTADAD